MYYYNILIFDFWSMDGKETFHFECTAWRSLTKGRLLVVPVENYWLDLPFHLPASFLGTWTAEPFIRSFVFFGWCCPPLGLDGTPVWAAAHAGRRDKVTSQDGLVQAPIAFLLRGRPRFLSLMRRRKWWVSWLVLCVFGFSHLIEFEIVRGPRGQFATISILP